MGDSKCNSCGVALTPNSRHRFQFNKQPGEYQGKIVDYCKVCCPYCYGGSGKTTQEEHSNG